MRWLLDEMLPAAAAGALDELGHDATSVGAADLLRAPDAIVYQRAVDQDRVLVTENFRDFALIDAGRVAAVEPRTALAFVRRDGLPKGGALAFHLAALLDEWAARNPDPVPGIHWP